MKKNKIGKNKKKSYTLALQEKQNNIEKLKQSNKRLKQFQQQAQLDMQERKNYEQLIQQVQKQKNDEKVKLDYLTKINQLQHNLEEQNNNNEKLKRHYETKIEQVQQNLQKQIDEYVQKTELYLNQFTQTQINEREQLKQKESELNEVNLKLKDQDKYVRDFHRQIELKSGINISSFLFQSNSNKLSNGDQIKQTSQNTQLLKTLQDIEHAQEEKKNKIELLELELQKEKEK